MTYKTGEVPQKNDEVMGKVDDKPARGRVLAVRENGDVLLTRRAPYAGPTEPLKAQHDEVPSADLSLVYRPLSARPAPAPVTKPAAKADKGAAKKAAAAK